MTNSPSLDSKLAPAEIRCKFEEIGVDGLDPGSLGQRRSLQEVAQLAVKLVTRAALRGPLPHPAPQPPPSRALGGLGGLCQSSWSCIRCDEISCS